MQEFNKFQNFRGEISEARMSYNLTRICTPWIQNVPHLDLHIMPYQHVQKGGLCVSRLQSTRWSSVCWISNPTCRHFGALFKMKLYLSQLVCDQTSAQPIRHVKLKLDPADAFRILNLFLVFVFEEKRSETHGCFPSHAALWKDTQVAIVSCTQKSIFYTAETALMNLEKLLEWLLEYFLTEGIFVAVSS